MSQACIIAFDVWESVFMPNQKPREGKRIEETSINLEPMQEGSESKRRKRERNLYQGRRRRKRTLHLSFSYSPSLI